MNNPATEKAYDLAYWLTHIPKNKQELEECRKVGLNLHYFVCRATNCDKIFPTKWQWKEHKAEHEL